MSKANDPLGVSFEAIRELSHPAGELSVAQSTQQASTAWAAARKLFPKPIPLYRPTWLPTTLRTAGVALPSTVSGDPADLRRGS
jgi:hypothetical protein